MLRLPPNARRYFQIGPRIRVGGAVGHLGQQAKLAGGKALENKWVDMGLGLIPGVGPGVAAAANAAGHVMDTSHGGIHTVGDVGRIALDSGEAYLGAKGANAIRDSVASRGVMGALRSGTSSLLGSKVPVPGGAAKPPMSEEDAFYNAIPGTTGYTGDQGSGNGGGFLDTLAGYGKDILGSLGGAGGLANKALMAGAIAQTAADRAKQARMIDEATKYATTSYNEKAPLRTQALSALANPSSPANHPTDLSSIYADQGSVYDQQRRGTLGSRVPVGGMAP